MRWSLLFLAVLASAAPFVLAVKAPVVPAVKAPVVPAVKARPPFRDYSNLVPTPPGYVLRSDPPAVLDKAKITNVQPTDKQQIIYRCWAYLGHPDTILDFKSFLRWGCQPSPHTCQGLNNVPRICGSTMFSIYDWVTPRHVSRLYRRCQPGAPRPIGRRTHKYIPYCVDYVEYLQRKYGGKGHHRGH